MLIIDDVSRKEKKKTKSTPLRCHLKSIWQINILLAPNATIADPLDTAYESFDKMNPFSCGEAGRGSTD